MQLVARQAKDVPANIADDSYASLLVETVALSSLCTPRERKLYKENIILPKI